jgi:hypothetical protein
LPSIIINGNPALVKKISGLYSPNYGADSEYRYYIEILFSSSKTNRTIEIYLVKNYKDFDDSEIEYLKHLLSTWDETQTHASTIDLGMPLAQ